jgi:hypothetical protein
MTENFAVDTAEDVEAPSSPPPAQVPRLKGSVGETGWLVLLAFVHETRRTCDTGSPVAFAKEQRMLVMMESVRTVLWASYTTLRMD